MEGREAMAFPGAHPPPFFFPGGAFTSVSASQSASPLHAPPDLRPMLNPNLHHTLSNSGLPFAFVEQRHQDFSHGIHMGMASSPTLQPPNPPPPSEPLVKKKRGRPRKYVPDGHVALELSPMTSSSQKLKSSSMSDPNAPKRVRGRPPGTGRKQRLANLGEWMNTSAGLAFAPHVISVEPGEDIVSKVHLFSQQRPRALCIMSGSGTISSVTLRTPASSVPSLTYPGPYEILSLGGSYLVNEEAGPKSRTGGISVSLSKANGVVLGGAVATLIADSLVQVVACSFVYGSAKAKAIKQENGSKEDDDDNIENNMETPAIETPPQPATEAAQTPPDFSAPAMSTGWPGFGGGGRSIHSRNHNHLTDIDLTRG